MKSLNTSNQYLLRAVARGSLQGTMQAIEDGADINIQDYNGQTPLHISFSRNNLAVADFLMQLGARDDIRDLNGLTPRNMADCALSQKNNQSKRCKALPFGANAEAALKCNFPANVVDAMIRTQQVAAVTKSSVSILFLDVVGFSEMRGAMAPVKILSMLQRLFGAFDALATHHGVERIDMIDGCYMAAISPILNPQTTPSGSPSSPSKPSMPLPPSRLMSTCQNRGPCACLPGCTAERCAGAWWERTAVASTPFTATRSTSRRGWKVTVRLAPRSARPQQRNSSRRRAAAAGKACG